MALAGDQDERYYDTSCSSICLGQFWLSYGMSNDTFSSKEVSIDNLRSLQHNQGECINYSGNIQILCTLWRVYVLAYFL